MATQIEKHVITLEEYERMVEAGVFAEGAPIELIRGEILEKAAVDAPHAWCVAHLANLMTRLADETTLAWPPGNPIALAGNSRPEPDLTLLRRRSARYAAKLPTAKDVLLLVEVSESSLRYDREVKGPLYAEAGIPIYWIVNVPDGVVEVYMDPVAGAYRQMQVVRPGDTLALPGALGGVVAINDILGGGDEPAGVAGAD